MLIFFSFLTTKMSIYNNNNNNKLTIVQWNCFCLTTGRQALLGVFLKRTAPDIVALNEVKLEAGKANFALNYPGYRSIFKVRANNPNSGGGVALLVREGINFIEDNTYEQFSHDGHE